MVAEREVSLHSCPCDPLPDKQIWLAVVVVTYSEGFCGSAPPWFSVWGWWASMWTLLKGWITRSRENTRFIQSQLLRGCGWVTDWSFIFFMTAVPSLLCENVKNRSLTLFFLISLIINTFIQQSMVAPSPEGISSLVLVRLPLFFILPVSEVQGFYKITWSGIWVVVCTLWSGPLDIWHQPTFPVFVEHAAEVWSFGALLWSRAWLNKDRHKPNIAKHLKHRFTYSLSWKANPSPHCSWETKCQCLCF